jgi:CRISPR/Cas system CMR-associated protein Cmr5 small subunit
LLLFGNYNQQLSELTFKGGLGLTRFWVQKVKTNDAFLTLSEKAKRFYKKHNNVINQLIGLWTTTLSTVGNLNTSISSAISGVFPHVATNNVSETLAFVNSQANTEKSQVQSINSSDDSTTFSLDDL